MYYDILACKTVGVVVGGLFGLLLGLLLLLLQTFGLPRRHVDLLLPTSLHPLRSMIEPTIFITRRVAEALFGHDLFGDLADFLHLRYFVLDLLGLFSLLLVGDHLLVVYRSLAAAKLLLLIYT